MVHAAKFLYSIRQSLSRTLSPGSPTSRSRQFYSDFQSLTKWVKPVDSIPHVRTSRFQYRLNLQRYYIHNFCLSGSKNIRRVLFGVSVVSASLCFQKHAAYAMDGDDILVGDHDVDLSGDDSDIFQRRKFWLPVFLFLVVFLNWGNPIILLQEVTLFLLRRKPTPLSVYFFIEQKCLQTKRQEPYFYKQKSLYAKKVEVQDYMLLCLARVEVGAQKFTLLGILGSWWTLSNS
ncbi:uncharacterized protein LOC110810213 [Carica papaya]|uniref:uncharacterized protein LOC110810213 n=1 Tax=Carica papaya TaxID=3649 RepID=UPI000B8CAE7A|nr:uncharacterized protein LOC110810213 [Carica papaya]